MSDVASLSVGLNLNAAHFKSQLLDSYGQAEKQARQYTKVAKDEAKKTAEAFALVNKELNFSLKNMMTLAGAGFSFNAIIATTRKYSQSLSDLSSITGVAGKQLDLLDNKALKMSRNSQFSAIQVVEAYKNIASAKPELLDVSGGLEDVTQSSITLAQAAGSTLPDAAKTLTLSLSQFGVGASEADRFINVLAAGAKFGASEINDTALAVKNSGVAASQANLSFEELNAAIQVLAEREVKGGEAGTALRNVILKLEKSTDSSFKPSVVGLEKALDNLSKKNLSTAQAVKLFGLENINAASILMQSKGKLSTLTQQLTGTNTAYEQSSIRINNLNGDLDTLTNSFEGLVIKMGQSGTGPLRTGIQSISGAVNYLSDNFNQVASIGLHTLVPVLGVKLTAGLRASTAEWYNQEMAMRKTAQTQAATAKATIANAQATITESQAQARALASHQALLKQYGFNVSYQKEHAVLSRTIREARISETLATEKLAAANGQLAIKSRIAAAAGKTLSGAYSLIGGPVGAAMLAGSALFYFYERAKQAKEEAVGLTEKVKDLAEQLNSFTDERLAVIKDSAVKDIKNAEDQLKLLRIEMASTKELVDSDSWFVTEERRNKATVTRREQLADEKDILNGILASKNQIADIDGILGSRVGPKQPASTNNKPKNEDVSTGSIWNGADAKATVGKYKDIRTELEIANASSLEKINLQEQQAKEKLIKSAKESGVSSEQLQQDLALVTEKYAKERLQITEKYSPAAAVIRQAKETNKELESLYQAGLISKELYQAKLVDPSNEIRATVDPDFKAQQEFELKIASLNEYLLQEKALLDESRSQNELSEEAYQERLLELQKRYGSLKVKAEIDNTNRMQQTTSAVFTASRDLFGGMADLVGTFTNESGAAYKTLFAISKGFAIADAILKLNSAIMQVMADPTAMTPAQKFANYAAVASAGGQVLSTIQSATLTGMSHDGINYVPKEGTWLLDKGERVLSSSENSDLTRFLDSDKSSNETTLNINVPVTIGNNSLSESDGKQLGSLIKQSVMETLRDQQRSGGILNRR